MMRRSLALCLVLGGGFLTYSMFISWLYILLDLFGVVPLNLQLNEYAIFSGLFLGLLYLIKDIIEEICVLLGI